MPSLSLYVHWPFCLSKCPYCDFNSHVRQEIDDLGWRDGLLADLRHEAEAIDGQLVSIFFGGGTPSLMPPATVAAVIDAAREAWPAAPDLEITLEANPSSVEVAKFADLAAAGVNRVSLGVQALNDATLALLGRAHGVDDALAALDVAQAAFARVSFDLIYARPGQTLGAWEAELKRALGFGTGHLSLYQLTIEPGTRFATDVRSGALVPLDPDAAADQYELTTAMTDAAGLPAYEISNYARPSEESRHNLTYWRYGDYVGIGPGAHGRRHGVATERHRKPENFLSAVARNGHGMVQEEVLTPTLRAREALLMGLRLAEGVDLTDLARRTDNEGRELIDHAEAGRLAKQGLLAREGDRLTVTPAGRLLLDAILPRIVR